MLHRIVRGEIVFLDESLESLLKRYLRSKKVYPVDDEDVPEDIKTADFDEVGGASIMVQPCPKPLTFLR